MQKFITILGLSTALVFSTAAPGVMAHDGDDDSNIRFQRVGYFGDVDANNDGKVSKSEYLAFEEDDVSDRGLRWRENHWDEMIEKFDANEDNQIEVVEVEDYAEARVAEAMAKLEDFQGNFAFYFDGDNFFDDGEFSVRLEEHLARVDEHVAEAIERLHERRIFVEKFDFDDHDFIFNRGPGFAFAMPHLRDMEDLDADGNGEVTLEEFAKTHEKMFERLDKNGDGVLDEEELDRLHLRGNFAFKWHKREEKDE